MLKRLPSPPILSDACHEFRAEIDLSQFDPKTTPGKLGLALPASLGRAVPKRQAEYLAGRFAARMALTEAGCAQPGALEPRADRSPTWPPGFVGSISHGTGFVCAAVASLSRVRALGRDTESVLSEHAAAEIRGTILRPDELELETSSGMPAGEYVGLVFSAKESLYKALAPLTGRYFDFLAARTVAFSRATGLLRLRLEVELGSGFGAGTELDARFAIESGLIHTAVELEA